MTLIAIDAGHGYNTPGKRSPDGMQEYAFNRAVAKEVILLLEKTGIQTIKTHHDSKDVPLTQRTNLANQKRADYFISIHANAFGNGSWNDANRIETYIHPAKESQAKPLALALHQALIKGTGRRGRGIKQADFHVLRETAMPAILLECGFMTNREEKTLLASNSYREKCGRIIADSIIQFLGVKAPAATLYRVQTGVFSSKNNAEQQVKQLQIAGFEAAIGIISK